MVARGRFCVKRCPVVVAASASRAVVAPLVVLVVLAVLAVASTITTMAASATHCRAGRSVDRAYTFPILFHVARGTDGPVVSDAWLTARVEAATRTFEPTHVDFVFEARSAPASVPAAVQSRHQRDSLQPHVVDGFINVFVVEELRSWEEGGGIIRGVHWHRTRHRGERGEHYIIIARYAAEYVLAHELGHFFGNPRHSRVRGNLMSYLRGDGPPTIDRGQIRRVAQTARRYVRTGELRAVEGPSR